jgi:hypothetical protein
MVGPRGRPGALPAPPAARRCPPARSAPAQTDGHLGAGRRRRRHRRAQARTVPRRDPAATRCLARAAAEAPALTGHRHHPAARGDARCRAAGRPGRAARRPTVGAPAHPGQSSLVPAHGPRSRQRQRAAALQPGHAGRTGGLGSGAPGGCARRLPTARSRWAAPTTRGHGAARPASAPRREGRGRAGPPRRAQQRAHPRRSHRRGPGLREARDRRRRPGQPRRRGRGRSPPGAGAARGPPRPTRSAPRSAGGDLRSGRCASTPATLVVATRGRVRPGTLPPGRSGGERLWPGAR